LFIAGISLVVVWLLAMVGFFVGRSSKVTAEKVAAHLRQVDLSRLSAEARAKTLRELAQKLNALTFDERRKVRGDAEWRRWFAAMTEEEKSGFIEATLPTGFQRMLTAFEQLPEDKRKRAVDDALRRLKRARDEGEPGAWGADGEGAENIPLSEELQKKIVKIGLKAFYSESSAQTKAELAPLLEEMQRAMERGVVFRR
jgi:hypothetical protein